MVRQTSIWSTGICVEIDITAQGAAVSSWRLDFSQRGRITSVWEGILTPTSGGYTVWPYLRNAQLARGQTTRVGYCAEPAALPTNVVVR